MEGKMKSKRRGYLDMDLGNPSGRGCAAIIVQS